MPSVAVHLFLGARARSLARSLAASKGETLWWHANQPLLAEFLASFALPLWHFRSHASPRVELIEAEK